MDFYDIFVSYAHQDKVRVERIVKALSSEGWSVFWDRTIPPGETWRSFIGAPLAQAPVVIVCWSKHSVDSDWVCQEADAANDRRALIPVRIDAVRPPLGFAHIQSADLVAWTDSGEAALPPILKLGIQRKLKAAGSAVRAGADAPPPKPDIARSRDNGEHRSADEHARLRLEVEQREAAALRSLETMMRQLQAAEEQRKAAEDAAANLRAENEQHRRAIDAERQRRESEAVRLATETEKRQREDEARRLAMSEEIDVTPDGTILCTFTLEVPGVLGFSRLAVRLDALKKNGMIRDWHTHGWQDRRSQTRAIVRFESRHDAELARSNHRTSAGSGPN